MEVKPLRAEPMNDDLRVIVVDDVADSADTLACLIELNGYRVRTASDGAAALELLSNWPAPCMILDIDMPGMDGLELAQRLRAEHGDNVVVIAMTGWAETDPRVAKTFEIVDHYWHKPVDPRVLDQLLPPV
jgi:DNA-binding response OmpR family regulator